MRILVVSNLFPPDYDGGFELSAAKIAHGLAARGHDVEAVTSRFRPGFQGATDEDPVWVHRIFEHRAQPMVVLRSGLLGKFDFAKQFVQHESVVWRNLPAFREFLRGRDYDVAYIFGLQDVGLVLSLELSRRGIPIVWSIGDYYLSRRRSYFSQSLISRALGATLFAGIVRGEQRLDLRHIAFTSRFMHEKFRIAGVPLDKVYVVPRGIEFDTFEDFDRPRDQPPTICAAGRISPDKGFHILLAAASSLAARRPDLVWKLRIFGSGDAEYGSQLRAQATAMGLEGRVDFMEARPRVEILLAMQRSSVFVNAPIWGEPFGNTTIEALAVGTPLIASDAGATREIVGDPPCALLYPPEDVSGLSAHLERVLDDPELRGTLAKKGVHRIAEAYTMDAVMDRTETMLREVAVSRGSDTGSS